MKKYLLFSIFILVFLGIGVVSASENITLDEGVSSQEVVEAPISDEIQNNTVEPMPAVENTPVHVTSKIEAKDVKTYYKDKSEFVAYLKDKNNRPIKNKKVSIFINNNNYDKITDNAGKVILKLNLKPGTYTALVRFAGDGSYAAANANAIVKVNKATLSVKTDNHKTYFGSGFHFKAKVINKITKNPVKGIKVAFKVYQNNKHKIYWAITDSKGIATLKKSFKAGIYKIVTSIKKSKYVKSKKTKSTLTVKETEEVGCSSVYLQVNSNEAVAGFRRDATNAKNLKIVKFKFAGKYAVKQYKTNSYFFHLITTADGWMVGTGGLDNPYINRAIEKLAGKMVKSGKIKKSYLRKIQGYEIRLGLGHFSIKAPNGKYAAVWGSGIKTGKLKPGEYVDVPNGRYCYRHGNWSKYSKDPAKAAIKVIATDSYGINRRDATAFHWKATTKDGKTTSTLKVYAANDNGRLVGRNTAYLMDNIYFKGKFISKYNLPKTPSSKFLGTYNFGSIDKLIKILTTVKASKLTKGLNESKTFDITVKNKKTGNPIKNLNLKIKIGNMVYTVKTDLNGVAHFDTRILNVGNYNVLVYSGNIKYYVSAKSTIRIT